VGAAIPDACRGKFERFRECAPVSQRRCFDITHNNHNTNTISQLDCAIHLWTRRGSFYVDQNRIASLSQLRCPWRVRIRPPGCSDGRDDSNPGSRFGSPLLHLVDQFQVRAEFKRRLEKNEVSERHSLPPGESGYQEQEIQRTQHRRRRNLDSLRRRNRATISSSRSSGYSV
jgi:hypothetical protein